MYIDSNSIFEWFYKYIDGIWNESFWRILHRVFIEVTKNHFSRADSFLHLYFLALSHSAIYNLLIVSSVRRCETKTFKSPNNITFQYHTPVFSILIFAYLPANDHYWTCKWTRCNWKKLVEKISTLFFSVFGLCSCIRELKVSRAKCNTRSTYHSTRCVFLHFFLIHYLVSLLKTVNLGHFHRKKIQSTTMIKLCTVSPIEHSQIVKMNIRIKKRRLLLLMSYLLHGIIQSKMICVNMLNTQK